MRKPSLKSHQLIKRAIAIVGKDAQRHEIERALRHSVTFVRRLEGFKQSGRYGVLTSAQKKAANRLDIALHRLAVSLKALESVGLDRSLSSDFPLDAGDIAKWRKRAREAASAKLPKPSSFNPAKQYAANLAAKLLEKHGLPLNVTRRGRFCQLAALLYGDETADFFHVCGVVKIDRLRS